MKQKPFSAASSSALIFGILAGLGGLTHGVGEVLQGNVKPDGIFINSWTQGPIATHMGGEPGLTLVPNLLVTGILTILVSLTLIAWAALAHKQHSGRIMILLSVIMLLVGGGVGPPLIGILAGVAGTGVASPSSWWLERLSEDMRRLLARLWPWIFGLAVTNGLFLVIGSVILVYVFDLNNPDLFVSSFFLAVLSLLLTLLTGRAYDTQTGPQVVAAQD